MTTEARSIWQDVEDARAPLIRWAGDEAYRTLRAVSGGACDAYEQGTTTVNAEDLAISYVEGQEEAFRDLLRTIYLKVVQRFARLVYDGLTEQERVYSDIYRDTFGVRERRDFPEGDYWLEVVLRYLEEHGAELVQGMMRRHASIIRAIIADGVAEGEGIEKIARRLRDELPALDRGRSYRIARTEVIRASNVGSIEGARATGLQLQKERIATQDPRTRPSHLAADGQLVGMDEMFTVGGHPAAYPGDPALPADETVNCRCAIAFVPIE